MLLERGDFGQLLEADGALADTGATGVLATRPQFCQQGAQAVNGPTVVGFLCAFFCAGTLGGLGFRRRKEIKVSNIL